MVDMANIINRAKDDFEEFHSLYIRVKQISTAKQEQQVIEMIQLCESAILRSDAWVQEYKGYILELAPAKYGTTHEGYKWMPMLEGIRDQLPLFRDLLYDQQLDYTRLEVVEKIRREVMELLAEHIYFRIF